MKKLEWWGYPVMEKLCGLDMYNHLYTIPACDRQTDRRTDGQTSFHGIVRTMHTHRAVKMNNTKDLKYHIFRCLSRLQIRYTYIHKHMTRMVVTQQTIMVYDKGTDTFRVTRYFRSTIWTNCRFSSLQLWACVLMLSVSTATIACQQNTQRDEVSIYTVSQKACRLMSDNNFGKCGLIFKILSPADS